MYDMNIKLKFTHNKNKTNHSNTTLTIKRISLYIATGLDSLWIIIRHLYKTFKTQQFFQHLKMCNEMESLTNILVNRFHWKY